MCAADTKLEAEVHLRSTMRRSGAATKKSDSNGLSGVDLDALEGNPLRCSPVLSLLMPACNACCE